MKRLFLALTVILAVLVGCQAQPNPEEMLAAMADALNAGDVDTAMALFTDDAVVKIAPALPPGSPDTYTGAEEIRAWFEELVAMNFEMRVEVLEVAGDIVTTRTSTWVDSTRQMGVAPLVATEVYTVQDGKIKGFTWTLSDESLAEVQAAMAALQPAPEADMTITFHGNGCTYDGPEMVSVGQIVANWNIENQDHEKCGLAIVTLDEGKTFEDLDAWPSVDKPPWATLVSFAETGPGGDSPAVADVTDGPIFLVCFTAYPEAKVGVLGPVEVVD
jgi:hypothetical protein